VESRRRGGNKILKYYIIIIMERCESQFCGKTFQQGSDKMAVKVGKKLGLPKESIDDILKKLRSKKGQGHI